jgi:YidC/Oxa1 family membrane protein insertase
MLIQLPVLWAVYYVFRDTALFGQAQFLGLSLAKNISEAGYLGIIFAIISGGSTFLSTWLLTPRNKDNKDAGSNPMASNSTNLIMSAFFGWISWTMPAGLVVYWIVNNLLQLGIQYMLNKALKRKAELAVSK